MESALKDAGVDSTEVQYINAHGTSTQLNDRVETEALKKLFGPHSRKLLISSIKSMTGHLLGAAGGVEAAATALTIFMELFPQPLIMKLRILIVI